MSRFNETKVNSAVGTVEVGPGLTWDQLYVALGPAGVNVVGGRTPDVGVAGLTLGGGECAPSLDKPEFHMFSGYSFKTSQYGLALDNTVGYELVLPNGTVVNVTPKDRNLWFGLRVSRKVDTD
jgi:FAD/FMN-containing dehydrogenase